MKIARRLYQPIAVFLTLFVLSYGYFFVYYAMLNLEYSFRTTIYILIGSMIFMSISYISRQWWWFVWTILVGAIFVVLSIVNYVYIGTYQTFYTLSAGQGKHLTTIFSTIEKFYSVIPFELYCISGVFFLLFFLILFLSTHRRRKQAQPQVVLCGINLAEPTIVLWLQKITIVVVIVLYIVIGIMFTDYYTDNPREGWFEQNYTVSDYGMYGYVFKSLYSTILADVHAYDFEDSISVSEPISTTTTQISTTTSPEITSQKPQTPLEYLQQAVRSIDSMHADEGSEVILPEFNQPPHILVFQLESVNGWALDHEPTPMPYYRQLQKELITVENYFPNGCHTIDSEFATLCSFFSDLQHPIPNIGSNNDYYCLPQILKDMFGYSTAGFHMNSVEFWNRDKLYPKWGIDHLVFSPEGYGGNFKLDDSIPIKKAIDYIASSSQPVFAEVVGFMSHEPYSWEGIESIAKLSNVPLNKFEYPLEQGLVADSTLDEEKMQIYFTYLAQVDQSIKFLFDTLQTKNLLDSTIVVILNDHRLYGFDDNLYKHFIDHNKQPFLLYVPGMDPQQVRETASGIDIAPTIMHLVSGTEDNVEAKHFLGTSIFSSEHPSGAVHICHNKVSHISNNSIVTGNIEYGIYLGIQNGVQISNQEIQQKGLKLDYIGHTVRHFLRNNLVAPSKF